MDFITPVVVVVVLATPCAFCPCHQCRSGLRRCRLCIAVGSVTLWSSLMRLYRCGRCLNYNPVGFRDVVFIEIFTDSLWAFIICNQRSCCLRHFRFHRCEPRIVFNVAVNILSLFSSSLCSLCLTLIFHTVVFESLRSSSLPFLLCRPFNPVNSFLCSLYQCHLRRFVSCV